MENFDAFYRWMKVREGRLYLGFVALDVSKNDIGNEIIENYSGEGFCNNSLDVEGQGWATWKSGLTAGLQFALSYSSDFWTVKINKLSGKPFMDTNPTIIGYTCILAFIEQSNVLIDEQIIKEIEEFVYSSWYNGNEGKVPNFSKLTFEESSF
ncbi:hypothetical protein [Flavobacterium tructae]|uniref:hypothetical protein n=1 Tax=Flavobacterium tructae TaxID=1114873 RepID=UPI0035A898A9